MPSGKEDFERLYGTAPTVSPGEADFERLYPQAMQAPLAPEGTVTRDPATGATIDTTPDLHPYRTPEASGYRGTPDLPLQEDLTPYSLYLPTRLATLTGRALPQAGKLLRTLSTGTALEVGQKGNQALGLDPGQVTEVGLPDALNFAVPGAFNYFIDPTLRAIPQTLRALRGQMTHPADRALVDFAESHGVDSLGYPDVVGRVRDAHANQAMTGQERRAGSGMPQRRALQQDQARTSVTGYADRARQELESTSYDRLPEVQAAAAQPDPRLPFVAESRRLLGQIAAAGDDPARVMAASVELQYLRRRMQSAEHYDMVSTLARPLGDVPPTETLATINEALAEVQNARVNVDPRGGTIHQLERMRTQLSPQTTTVHPTDAFGRTGAPPTTTTTTAPNPYDAMRQLHSDLGALADEPSMVNTRGATLLGKVREAVAMDMQRFVQASGKPDLIAAQQMADTYHRTQIILPFRESGVVDTTRALAQQPDQLLDRIFQPGRGDQAQLWYDAMDARGQAAARARFLDESLHGRGTEGAGGALKPSSGDLKTSQLAGTLERQRAATNVFFQGRPQAELTGYTNLMRHMERAGAYMEDSQTGQRVIGGDTMVKALGGAVAGGQVGGLEGAIAGGVLQPLAEAGWNRAQTAFYMSKAGRNFLLAAGQLTPGSPEMQALVAQIAHHYPEIVPEQPRPGP